MLIQLNNGEVIGLVKILQGFSTDKNLNSDSLKTAWSNYQDEADEEGFYVDDLDDFVTYYNLRYQTQIERVFIDEIITAE